MPISMYYHDNYPYYQAVVTNSGVPATGHMYSPCTTQLFQYAHWYMPSYSQHYMPPSSMEYQSPAAIKRIPQKSTVPTETNFTIKNILGLDSDGLESCTRVSCTDENSDSIHATVPTGHSTPQFQQVPNVDSVSHKPSCASESSTPEKHKRKRIRTTFTAEQLKILEEEFKKSHYMVGEQRLVLAKSLSLTQAQVKVWFQNRRIKLRRQQIEMQQNKLSQKRSESPEIDYDSDSRSV